MFDIGFGELVLIGIVALVVIGPERLPKVARTAGLWVGRMRGFVMSVKSDIDREMRAEDLRRIMDEQARSSGIHEILEETRESVEELNKPDYLVKAMPSEEKTESAENTENSIAAELPAEDKDVQSTDKKHDA
jgi:sec-independent protein translocase protein TatB